MYICMTRGRSVMIAALLKLIGVVGQSDIFYECPFIYKNYYSAGPNIQQKM